MTDLKHLIDTQRRYIASLCDLVWLTSTNSPAHTDYVLERVAASHELLEMAKRLDRDADREAAVSTIGSIADAAVFDVV